MKFFIFKTGKKSNHYGLMLLIFSYCCHASAQQINPKAQQFLNMLKKTDGREENMDFILGPEQPKKLFSDLKELKTNTKDFKINTELLTWGSSGQKPRIFKNKENSDFFKKIFHLIEKSFPDIQLNRINLFHAHLIQSSDDFLLIFHAFEYPVDLEPNKFSLAKKIDPQIVSFTSQSESYFRRNLIWSLIKNKIWRFDTSPKSKFNFLVRSPAFEIYPKEVIMANALQEGLFGKNIADINYFPSEEKQLFINLIIPQ